MCYSLMLFALMPLHLNSQCLAARKGEKNTIAEAIKQLKDKDRDIRARAFRELRQSPPNEQASVAALVELLKERDSDIRYKAAVILSKTGPATWPVLCQALGDKRREVREGAAWALGYIGPKARGKVPKLIQTLEKDEEEQVQLAAVDALGAIGGKEAINALIKTLKGNGNKSVRWKAALVLGQQEYSAQVMAPLVETLAMKQTDIDDGNIVSGAVWSLTDLGFPAVHPLLDAIKNPNFGGREHGIRALAGVFKFLRMDQRLTGDPIPGDIKVALPQLIESAKDPRKEIRLATMEALEEMGEHGKDALTVVRSSLKDSSPSVRIMAARTLYHIGGDWKLGLPVFIEAMRNPDVDVRRSAIEEVEQLGQRGAPAVPQLIESLGDPDTQSEALSALGRIGPKARRAVPRLIELLKDKDNDQWLRAAAMSTLKQIGPAAKAAVPLLREIADKSEDPLLQEAASSALEAITKSAGPVHR
jgi:HEAT repeat protein